MCSRERTLRRLALNDSRLMEEISTDHSAEPADIDDRSRALVRLGALLATDSPTAAVRQGVADAMCTGVSADELVAALLSLLPTIGMPRAAAAAPKLGLAIGYDVDAALEAAGSNG
jgi:4-carboxymuconolactone decarboxylase